MGGGAPWATEIYLPPPVCHWNLNSILAHNKIKISLLEAYDTIYHNDIIALTETQLNQRISDDKILINGFSGKPFQKDDPSGDRYRGICVYYKENLPIKRRSDLEMLLAEGIVTEIVLSRKKFSLLQFIDHITCLLTILKCLYRESNY